MMAVLMSTVAVAAVPMVMATMAVPVLPPQHS